MHPVLLHALALIAPVSAAQRDLHLNPGDGNQGEHGHTLAAAGDLDGDGLGDYWAGAPALFAGGLPRVGLVSGADGTTLRELLGGLSFDVFGSAYSQEFGRALAAGRDLDGDGLGELVVGAPRFGANEQGGVSVYSGASSARLWSRGGRVTRERFGLAVALLDDHDGDGVADIAVGAPGPESGGALGSVRFFSGATGALLGELVGDEPGAGFGSVLANLGDLDGDGCAELGLGLPQGAGGRGQVRVLAGRTGARLLTLVGDAPGDRFGSALTGLRDQDGDGRRELAVGAPGARLVRVFTHAGSVRWSVTMLRNEGSVYDLGPDKPLFGWALCDAGDQDHDGVIDVAAGYPEASALVVLSGRDGATLERYSSTSLHSSTGEPLPTHLGYALANVGDLDRDGDEELVVGAPTYSVGTSFNLFTGRTVLLDGGLRRDWREGAPGRFVGVEVAAVGDQDGDGRDDVAFSEFEGGLASVVITSGRDRSVLRVWSAPATSGFGGSIARAGDTDGDGVEDVLVGAFTDATSGLYAGKVVLYSGASGAVLHTFHGSSGDYLGTAVAGLGDLDGDGLAEVAMSAPGLGGDPARTGFCSGLTPRPGYVRVFSGHSGALLYQVDGLLWSSPFCSPENHIGECFGFALTGVGDWNRDGVPDFAVGAPGAGIYAGGAVRVFSGVDGALVLDVPGLGGQSEFGVALAGAPDFDVDADGWVDLVVGEEEIYYGGAVSGGASVISSQTGLVIRSVHAGSTPQRYGGPAGPGYAVAVAGDQDGDGHSDFALGNPAFESSLGIAAGRVVIHSGATGIPLASVSGSSSWDYLGYSIATLGDIDGDGRTDLAVGAPTSFNTFFSALRAESRVRVLASAHGNVRGDASTPSGPPRELVR